MDLGKRMVRESAFVRHGGLQRDRGMERMVFRHIGGARERAKDMGHEEKGRNPEPMVETDFGQSFQEQPQPKWLRIGKKSPFSSQSFNFFPCFLEPKSPTE